MKRRFVIVAGILVGVVTGLFVTATKGGLAYFSPFTLEYETQSEFTVLNGTWIVYRSGRVPVENRMAQFLREADLVAPDASHGQRWELVFHWNEAWKDGHGALYDVLIRDRESIINWSRADAERARLYWSEAFKCLRSDRKETQWAGPEILRAGRHCNTVAELQECISVIEKEFNIQD